MAKKEKKKPKHTALVVPGSGEGKKRKHTYKARQERKSETVVPPAEENQVNGKKTKTEETARNAVQQKKVTGETQQVTSKKESPVKKDNAIRIDDPKNHPVRKKARQRKNLKRLRNMAVLGLVVCLVIFFATGAYMPLWVVVSEGATNARLGMQKGGGFPMEFSITGFADAASMGQNGFAVLGEKDIAIVSQTGRESYRGQHGFVNANMTASQNRVCAYSRRGRAYTIYNREGIYYEGVTEADIQFAHLSDGGWLALCTASRSRYEVTLYSPAMTGDYSFRWSSADDIPLRAAFWGNRTLALGCISPSGGAMGSTIYVFQTNRNPQKAQQAAIRVEGAIPLEMHYVAQNRLLVVYNTGYAAIYNGAGEEVARYDYGGGQPYAADVRDGCIALLFGAGAQAGGRLVVLDAHLQEQGNIVLQQAGGAQVLASKNAVYVLEGQQVLAYSREGAELGNHILDGKPYGLVWGGVPLVVSADDVKELVYLLEPEQDEPPRTPSSAPVSQSVVA